MWPSNPTLVWYILSHRVQANGPTIGKNEITFVLGQNVPIEELTWFVFESHQRIVIVDFLSMFSQLNTFIVALSAVSTFVTCAENFNELNKKRIPGTN